MSNQKPSIQPQPEDQPKPGSATQDKSNIPLKYALKIIQKVAPLLTLQKLRDGLVTYFDPNLSWEENKERMLQAIQKGIFGEHLAEAASFETKETRSLPELLQDPTVQDELKEHGIIVDENDLNNL